MVDPVGVVSENLNLRMNGDGVVELSRVINVLDSDTVQ